MTEKKQSHPSLWWSCSFTFLVLLIVAGIVVYFECIDHDGQKISVGVLYNQSDNDGKNSIRAIEDAVEDIFEAQRSNIIFLKMFTSIILFKRNKTESAIEAFERLHGDGIRIFAGVTAELQVEASKRNLTSGVIFFSSPTTHLEGDGDGLYKLRPNTTSTALAYLSYINATVDGDENDDIFLAPIMKDTTDISDLYSTFIKVGKRFPRIRMLTPNVYTTTEYPRSDAFEVVNMLGDTVSAQPRAHVLVLSVDILPEIVGVTHINPDLDQRRWFAVEAAHLASRLKSSGRGRRLSPMEKRLTTITYLGDSSDETLRLKYLKKAFQRSPVSDSVYADWLVYKSIWSIIESPDTDDDMPVKDIFVSLSLKTNNDIQTIPNMPWLAEDIVKIQGDDVVVEEIKTINLNLDEIKSSLNSNCVDPELHYTSRGHIYMGDTSVSSSLSQDQHRILAPMMTNVSMLVTCKGSILSFVCHPVSHKNNKENVKCVSRMLPKRVRRELQELEGNVKVSTDVDESGSENVKVGDPTEIDYLLDASEHFNEIIDTWHELTPGIVGCFASVAG